MESLSLWWQNARTEEAKICADFEHLFISGKVAVSSVLSQRDNLRCLMPFIEHTGEFSSKTLLMHPFECCMSTCRIHWFAFCKF